MLSGLSRAIAPTPVLALYTSHTGSADSPRQAAPGDPSAQPRRQKSKEMWGRVAVGCREGGEGAALEIEVGFELP